MSNSKISNHINFHFIISLCFLKQCSIGWVLNYVSFILISCLLIDTVIHSRLIFDISMWTICIKIERRWGIHIIHIMSLYASFTLKLVYSTFGKNLWIWIVFIVDVVFVLAIMGTWEQRLTVFFSLIFPRLCFSFLSWRWINYMFSLLFSRIKLELSFLNFV